MEGEAHNDVFVRVLQQNQSALESEVMKNIQHLDQTQYPPLMKLISKAPLPSLGQSRGLVWNRQEG